MSRILTGPNQSLIDEVQILPRKGILYQLQGPGHSGKSMREFAEAWTAMTLMNGTMSIGLMALVDLIQQESFRHFPITSPALSNYCTDCLLVGGLQFTSSRI